MSPRGLRRCWNPLPNVQFVASGVEADIIVAFVASRAELDEALELRDSIVRSGAVWIAWPKKSSGVRSDVTEDTIREHALPLGLVDNKVCAIDATWSGLRLVWRKDRR